jgi:hypothetical protein
MTLFQLDHNRLTIFFSVLAEQLHLACRHGASRRVPLAGQEPVAIPLAMVSNQAGAAEVVTAGGFCWHFWFAAGPIHAVWEAAEAAVGILVVGEVGGAEIGEGDEESFAVWEDWTGAVTLLLDLLYLRASGDHCNGSGEKL